MFGLPQSSSLTYIYMVGTFLIEKREMRNQKCKMRKEKQEMRTLFVWDAWNWEELDMFLVFILQSSVHIFFFAGNEICAKVTGIIAIIGLKIRHLYSFCLKTHHFTWAKAHCSTPLRHHNHLSFFKKLYKKMHFL